MTTAENEAKAEKLNTKAAGVVAIAVMCSRLLGLLRELIFAACFGAGWAMDAFIFAFKIPNLLRDLFAEGALSTAFITVFSKKVSTEGDGAAWALASKMATLTVVFMSAVSLLGVVYADWIVTWLAPGFGPEKAALAILLTRIMYPFILLVSLAALVMGMLNAKNIFGVPALASSFFNIGSILGGLGFGYWIDPTFGPRAFIGLAMGTLLGGLMQLLFQLPSLRKAGFRFRPDFRWRDAGVVMVLGLMLPSVIAASAVQINVMVNAVFATLVGDGAMSWLQFAFRLMQLPLGIFGVAVATVTLPVVSRMAAKGDIVEFRTTLAKAMRLAIFLTLPAAVGLIMLAHPIIALIYERGKFTGSDSLRTAEALQFYAIGLVGYSCIKVLSPAFYAINRRWTPMTVSFASIGLNLAMNWFFIFQINLGHRGLALSTAISACVNFGLLYLLMHRHAGHLETAKMLSNFARCVAAATVLGGICYGALVYFGPLLTQGDIWIRGPLLLGVIALAGAGYVLACLVTGVPEVRLSLELLLSKLRRKRQKS